MLSVLGTLPSFGFGDRLGLATPGHCQALLEFGGPIQGVFAQQSIREMNRTKRTPNDVMQDAERALSNLGFEGDRGADADHLKTRADVDDVFDTGFTFFTIDPSDYVNSLADGFTAGEVEEHYARLEEQPHWVTEYADQKITLDTNWVLEFDEIATKRCALKYGLAVKQAIALGNYIVAKAKDAGREIEIEMSIDETEQPTTEVEHFVFADQLIQAGLPLVSVAPRFVGNFEKGIDFFGDREAFESTLKQHAAIARHFDCYKLSLHSGSDKLSIYDAFARETQGRFHVKTAGTSYLEALRVAGTTDESLFRQIVEYSRTRFETDRATYHLSSGLADAVSPADLSSGEAILLEYMEKNAGRQILHVTFGSVLNHPEIGDSLRNCLQNNSRLYNEFLLEHFRKHLQPLTTGLSSLS